VHVAGRFDASERPFGGVRRVNVSRVAEEVLRVHDGSGSSPDPLFGHDERDTEHRSRSQEHGGTACLSNSKFDVDVHLDIQMLW